MSKLRIYINGSLHKLFPCPLCVIFNRKKKTRQKEDSEKKDFIYALHFIVSLTFCTYLKRLISVSGLTEPFSRSAKILYNMYMYFYSYAYKYMSVICLLCPVVLILYLLHKLKKRWCVGLQRAEGLKKTAFRACKCEFLFAASQQRRQTFGAGFCLFAALLKTLNSLSFLWQKDKTNRQSGGYFTFSKVLLLKTLLF